LTITHRKKDAPMANPTRYPGTPGWVKAFGIIAVVLIVLFVILHLSGYGPGGHMQHMQ
jgi:hypothetical protein